MTALWSAGSSIATDATAAGCMATTFTPTDDFDSVTGPGLQGLLPSCVGDGFFDGASECRWHGGSELVDATLAIVPKESRRQDPPHCTCSIETVIRSPQRLFTVEVKRTTTGFATSQNHMTARFIGWF